MTNKNTAPTRKKPSRAMLVLDRMGLLVGDMLDFGCGRGFDADYYGMDKYDPNWEFPEIPNKLYDTITCNWVLNVVSEKEQDSILKQIRNLLKPNGKAYICVRRDIKEDYLVKNYIQRLVFLDLKSIYKQKNIFEIYVMET